MFSFSNKFFINQRKKLNRSDFDELKNQYDNLLVRLATLERDFDDIVSKRLNVSLLYLNIYKYNNACFFMKKKVPFRFQAFILRRIHRTL